GEGGGAGEVAQGGSDASPGPDLGPDQRGKLGRTEPAGDFGPAQGTGPLFCRTRARAAERNASHAAAASSPLNFSPCLLALITTFSPSLMRPDRIISASGSCTDFWITRLS